MVIDGYKVIYLLALLRLRHYLLLPLRLWPFHAVSELSPVSCQVIDSAFWLH